MGIFSRIKRGISSKANAAIDKAISPEKELEIAIAELEDGRKKALAELVSYRVTAKQLDADVEKHKAKAVEWERRAMIAIKAGDDEAAKLALREKKTAEAEAGRIERDKHEAASYAIQLNKSRKEFETKLQMLKMRKGTLATQLAVARSPGGDAFGNDTSVWDRFKDAEDRIDSEAIATEVDAAMRGEDAAAANELDAKIAKLAGPGGVLGVPDGPDDALAKLKDKMAEQKAAKQKQLEAGAVGPAPTTSGATGAPSTSGATGATSTPSSPSSPGAPTATTAKAPKADK